MAGELKQELEALGRRLEESDHEAQQYKNKVDRIDRNMEQLVEQMSRLLTVGEGQESGVQQAGVANVSRESGAATVDAVGGRREIHHRGESEFIGDFAGGYRVSSFRAKGAIPKFDGAAENWTSWSREIIQLAVSMPGVYDAITRTDDVVGYPLNERDLLASGFSRAEIASVQEAFTLLFTHVTDPSVKDRIFNAGSPSGARRALQTWFDPRTVQAANQLLKCFETVKLVAGQNPMKLITNLESLAAKISRLSPQDQISEDKVNIRILDALSESDDYEVETRSLLAKSSVTREEILTPIGARYTSLYGDDEQKSGGALMAVRGKGGVGRGQGRNKRAGRGNGGDNTDEGGKAAEKA